LLRSRLQTGERMEYGLSFMSGLISLALTIWLVFFSVLVIQKLDKIIELLKKK
jgi:hypothetical protein